MEMNNSLQKYAHIAGLTYILVILIGSISVGYIDTILFIPGDSTTTVSNILSNESPYRLAVLGELIMFVLKTINQPLALLALLMRISEAVLGAGIAVLSGLIPLLLLHSQPDLVPLFLQVRSIGLDFVLIFIGVGGTIYCYLFLISRYVPRFLAYWGIFTYISMFLMASASILFSIPESTKMFLYAPGGIFEILFGLWLLIKGVRE
jgi:hypothetical protein